MASQHNITVDFRDSDGNWTYNKTEPVTVVDGQVFATAHMGLGAFEIYVGDNDAICLSMGSAWRLVAQRSEIERIGVSVPRN